MNFVDSFIIFLFSSHFAMFMSSACEIEKVDYRIPAGSTRVSVIVKRFRPYFSYDYSCNSYPAVSDDGKMSAGLKGSRSTAGCRDSTFSQTYVRAAYFQKSYRDEKAYIAIMYAQFAPKDNDHRYDWEDVIVFVDKNYHPIKAAASFHGGYLISRPMVQHWQWDGDRVRAKYTSRICNKAFEFSENDGDDPPMKSWYMMKSEERIAIEKGCWEKGIPKLTNKNFKNTLDRAWTEKKPSFWVRLFCRV